MIKKENGIKKTVYLKRFLFKRFKRSKFIFNIVEWLKWHKEIDYHKRTNLISKLKSNADIKRELKLVKKYWNCGTFHYFRYGLQYKHLTDDEILDYVPTYFFHKYIEKEQEGIDIPKYRDKLTQAILFEERTIPTAKVVGVLQNNICKDLVSCQEIDLQTILESKLKETGAKLFFKPTGNSGGAGIIVLKRIENYYVANGVRLTSLNDIFYHLNKRECYIIQEKIEQSEQLNKINSSSVNTLRVVVHKEGNQMKLKSCILRMGRNGKEVDNSAQGGISIKVDCISGLLADYAVAEHGAGVYYSHPDSKIIFKNLAIENWGIVKLQIEAIANQLIDFRNIALDIAVTDEGAKLIEFNFHYGIEHQQCVLGGVRRLFNISNN